VSSTSVRIQSTRDQFGLRENEDNGVRE